MATKTEKRGRWAVRLIHLNAGWRYWVFERAPGERELGDFATEAEAHEAIAKAEAA
jgi:hypothetical protein